MFSNSFNRTGPGRFKTPIYKSFENGIKIWALKNHAIIKQSKQFLADKPFLRVDLIFYFPYERIITKKGLPKRLDCDNRIKAALDAVSKLLEIDDCAFWCGSFEKRVGKDNYMDIKIEAIEVEDAIRED